MASKWSALLGAMLLAVGAGLPSRGGSGEREAASWPGGAMPAGLMLLQPADPAGDEDKGEGEADSPLIRRLTAAEINRIRFLELKAMRSTKGGVDSVSVRIPRATIQEFLVEMEGDPDFNTREKRGDFLKMTAPQKLQIIAKYKGEAYADRVEIRSDPEVFVEFRKRVMPVILRTCATGGCHTTANENAAGFALFKDPKKTPPTTYANFIVLNELTVGGEQMINRGSPDRSLLLTYLLPRLDVRPELRHPGEIDFKPPFTSEKNPRFRRLRDWIGSLNHPAVDYNVRILPQKTPTSEPADDAPAAGAAGDRTGPTP